VEPPTDKSPLVERWTSRTSFRIGKVMSTAGRKKTEGFIIWARCVISGAKFALDGKLHVVEVHLSSASGVGNDVLIIRNLDDECSEPRYGRRAIQSRDLAHWANSNRVQIACGLPALDLMPRRSLTKSIDPTSGNAGTPKGAKPRMTS
jgi:hypothetical protein